MEEQTRNHDDARLRGENRLPGWEWSRLLLSLVVALLGVVLSLVFSWLLTNQEQRLAEAQFRYDAARRVNLIQRAVTEQLNDVNMLAVYYAGSELVERHEFHTFATKLLDKHSGIAAVGWAPHILAGQRQAQEQFVRSEGITNYRISERDQQGGFVPARPRAEYWPILFIEPASQNRRFFGFDISSNPTYREALQRTTATGRPTAGLCDRIETDGAGHPLVYVVMPAQDETSEHVKRPADQPAPAGFVFGLFDIRAIVESAWSQRR